MATTERCAVTIDGTGPYDAKICIDDKDISSVVTELELRMEAGRVTELRLTLLPMSVKVALNEADVTANSFATVQMEEGKTLGNGVKKRAIGNPDG